MNRHTRGYEERRLAEYLRRASAVNTELAREIVAKLGDRALRCHWSDWALNTFALKIIRHTVEDAVTLRKLVADDYGWLENEIHAEAVRGGWRGIEDFGAWGAKPERLRAAALCWLRGVNLGSCPKCGEYRGGCASLGLCRDCKYGCAVANNVETAKICQISGEPLE